MKLPILYIAERLNTESEKLWDVPFIIFLFLAHSINKEYKMHWHVKSTIINGMGFTMAVSPKRLSENKQDNFFVVGRKIKTIRSKILFALKNNAVLQIRAN